MDRRKSLKLIITAAVAAPVAVAGCNNSEKEDKALSKDPILNLDRNPEELAYEKSLASAENFFSEQEMATISVLVDIIIPKDKISGSATDAGVPEFIEFIVKDMPQHQVPLRGGLRWLDMQCLKKYDKAFIKCSSSEQIEIIDKIAYPEKTKGMKEWTQGVSFFSLLRNLTATGFYTSKIGVADIGYAGNRPNQWNGVPAEVLAQYNIAYTQKELAECVSFDSTKGV